MKGILDKGDPGWSRERIVLAAGKLIVIGFLIVFPGLDRAIAQEKRASVFENLDSRIPEAAREGLVESLGPLSKSEELPALYRKKVGLLLQSLDGAEPVEGSSDSLSEAGQRLYAKQISEIGISLRNSEPAISAHLFDLALQLNPDDVDLAYELEVLRIRERVSLSWEDSLISGAAMKGAPAEKPNLPGGVGRKQALIKGLLVQELPGSRFAGSASQMNATVLGRSDSKRACEVRFNQGVGKMMSGALTRAVSLVEERHGELPQGIAIELSFEEQYIPKDGPSAAVASFLLLESIIQDIDFDQRFAVTGDMSEAGQVGPVGGIDGKIRGARKRGCEVIAIPVENAGSVADLLLLEGAGALTGIQIFSIKTHAEALALARVPEERSEELRSAISEFAKIQSAMQRSSSNALLRSPKVQQSLRRIVQLAPNHLSARYLLLAGLGRNPKELTLSGSLTAIDQAAAPLIKGLEQGRFEETGSFEKNLYLESKYALQRQRAQLDPRTRDCADAIIEYSGYVDTWVNKRPNTRQKQIDLLNKLQSSGEAVGKEFERLHSRADVKKELGDSD